MRSTARCWRAACEGKKTSLKAALSDQRVVAGLGNIYVCEALHRAHLSPRRIASTIATEIRRAAPITRRRWPMRSRAVLNDAIRAGGSSLRDHRRTDGELGEFQHTFRVYDRAGEKCPTPRCKGTIKRIVQGTRSRRFSVRCVSADPSPRRSCPRGGCRGEARRVRVTCAGAAPPGRRLRGVHPPPLRGRDGHPFTYTACCVTTKSTRPSRSACRHSSGRLTIGSSCTLKLVLISTGSPVGRGSAAGSRRTADCRRAHDLRPRGAVDMHHGRNARAPLGLHAAGDGHEVRRVAVDVGDLEHARGVFLQHIGRERHELGRSSRLFSSR